nr:MAG TPA: hypothetical protein [Bacteriophage sp.]
MRGVRCEASTSLLFPNVCGGANLRIHHNVGTCLWHVSMRPAMRLSTTTHKKGSR